jgi:hypothetical protein
VPRELSGIEKVDLQGTQTQQPSVRLKIKIKLGGMGDVTVDNGARPAVAAAVRVALALWEEPGRKFVNKYIAQRQESYRTWWRCNKKNN